MEVVRIDYSDCRDFILNHHYLRRNTTASYCYGLYRDSELIGIATYGRPVAHSLVKGAFGGKYMDTFLELNRLYTIDDLPKNTLSWFLSKTLKMLPSPMVVVSYADISVGHTGSIYKATNWIYTGLSAKRKDYKLKGVDLHGASIMDKYRGVPNRVAKMREDYGDLLYTEDRPRKHRFFYLIGSKKQKKDMMNNMKYKIIK